MTRVEELISRIASLIEEADTCNKIENGVLLLLKDVTLTTKNKRYLNNRVLRSRTHKAHFVNNLNKIRLRLEQLQ